MGIGSSFPGIGATSVYRSKFHQYRICYIIAYCGWPDALSRVARRILPQQSVSWRAKSMPRGYGSIQQFRRQQFTDSLAASSKFGTLTHIYTNKEPMQPWYREA
jgi:hypothetical protein